MAVFSKLSFKAVLRKVLGPVLTFVALVVLSILLANLIITKVLPLRTNLVEANAKEQQLSQKLSELSSVSNETKANVATTVAALPSTNSSLLALGQLKQLAQSFSVVIPSFKVDEAGVAADGLGSAKISFSVIAPDMSLMMAFLKETANVAPIMKLDELSVSSEAGGIAAKVSLITFWAPFPEMIPELASPLVALGSGEQETLARLQELSKPSISGLAPTQPEGRANPFSL